MLVLEWLRTFVRLSYNSSEHWMGAFSVSPFNWPDVSIVRLLGVDVILLAQYEVCHLLCPWFTRAVLTHIGQLLNLPASFFLDVVRSSISNGSDSVGHDRRGSSTTSGTSCPFPKYTLAAADLLVCYLASAARTYFIPTKYAKLGKVRRVFSSDRSVRY